TGRGPTGGRSPPSCPRRRLSSTTSRSSTSATTTSPSSAGPCSRGDRGAAPGGAQGDTVAGAEEPREPRPQERREAAAGRGAGAEPTVSHSLLHEGGIETVLGAAGQAVRDHGP